MRYEPKADANLGEVVEVVVEYEFPSEGTYARGRTRFRSWSRTAMARKKRAPRRS
jgi:hypothetical protein